MVLKSTFEMLDTYYCLFSALKKHCCGTTFIVYRVLALGNIFDQVDIAATLVKGNNEATLLNQQICGRE